MYLALLNRKAQLIEDLAPHEKAGAAGAATATAPIQGQSPGNPGQWSSYPIPPEAMQAMGIDAGDYVMYAIVEEHFIPPEALQGVRKSRLCRITEIITIQVEFKWLIVMNQHQYNHQL